MLEKFENLAITAGQKITPIGGGAAGTAGTIGFMLDKNNIMLMVAVVGALTAILSLLITSYFQGKRNVREQVKAEFDMKMALNEDRRKEDIANIALTMARRKSDKK